MNQRSTSFLNQNTTLATRPQSHGNELRVAIVDRDYSSRGALRQLIDGTPSYRCVADYPTVARALAASPRDAPEVLLLEGRRGNRKTASSVAPLLGKYPNLAVLMVNASQDEECILESLLSGARGYLLRKTSPSRLIEAIREARDGGAPMSPEVARTVVQLLRKSGPPEQLHEQPSRQERELLALLSRGHSYQSAGKELGVSINTVRNYIRSIYQKLQVHTKSAAVTKALRAGLI